MRFALFFLVACAQLAFGWNVTGNTRGLVWTAQSVSDVSLSDVHPTPVTCPPAGCDWYLSTAGCLGPAGPISSIGPLGMLGPLGDNAWNPSQAVSGWFDWSDWASKNLNGPMSSAGPLGQSGPLSAAGLSIPPMNDFVQQLHGHGLWFILGPLSVLGAVGPLGPLGPVGGHGYLRDPDTGDYTSGGQVQRTYDVDYDGQTTYTYELYEMYEAKHAKQMQDNDCSFMVLGELSSAASASDRYTFTCQQQQYVSVVVVPEKSLDVFAISLYNAKTHRKIATSAMTALINFIIVDLPVSTEFYVDVTLDGSLQTTSHGYRLYVTGSTHHAYQFDAAQANIKGKHLSVVSF